MATAQLNARIDSREKQAGDAVLERFGVPATQVIRDTWRYMAEHQRLPHYVKVGTAVQSDEADDMCARIDSGAGMAVRLAREAGIRAVFESMTYDQIRETAYEEMLIEQGRCHV